VYAIANPRETADPAYAQGLRAAVSAALDFGFAGIERGEDHAPPIPVLLLGQARLAARNGVSLDTVLRRYFAGYALLGDFVVQEAEDIGVRGGELKRVLRTLAAVFDRLLAAASEEHGREAEREGKAHPSSQFERIERLLTGEIIDTSDLAYDLNAVHIGAIASGAGAVEAVRGIASAVDCRILLVPRRDDAVWAWFGMRALDPEATPWHAVRALSVELPVALGEPLQGVGGWRLTHRQARTTFPVALRRGAPVRYGEDVLLGAVLENEVHTDSLQQIFMAPLRAGRDDGAVALETLRAYFASKRNAASAAAALGVSPQAVNSRLRIIEERLGRSIYGCAVELEVALRVNDLENMDSQGDRSGLA
jgi:hypothetical protein